MVEEAEKFKDDDEKLKKKVEAKGKLENYCFSVRNSALNDDKMKEKLGDDANVIDKLTNETLEWLDKDEERTEGDYTDKYDIVQKIISPILQKVYQTEDAQSNAPSNAPVSSEEVPLQTEDPGPTIDEVD
jgi:molecular chaperone DnaK (HSP70)